MSKYIYIKMIMLNKIIQTWYTIERRGQIYYLFCRSDSILPFKKERTGLYHYAGSLTTPDCHEYVQWLVFDKPLKISKNGLVSILPTIKLIICSSSFTRILSFQLKWLREIHDSDGYRIVDNYRPTQANANTLYFFGKA